jgi:hypothetical protein
LVEIVASASKNCEYLSFGISSSILSNMCLSKNSLHHMVLYNDSYIEINIRHPQLFSDRKESFHIYVLCIMAGTSYLLRKISRELGRYRDLFEQRMSCFPGPSAEENLIFRYECTSYTTRL